MLIVTTTSMFIIIKNVHHHVHKTQKVKSAFWHWNGTHLLGVHCVQRKCCKGGSLFDPTHAQRCFGACNHPETCLKLCGTSTVNFGMCTLFDQNHITWFREKIVVQNIKTIFVTKLQCSATVRANLCVDTRRIQHSASLCQGQRSLTTQKLLLKSAKRAYLCLHRPHTNFLGVFLVGYSTGESGTPCTTPVTQCC